MLTTYFGEHFNPFQVKGELLLFQSEEKPYFEFAPHLTIMNRPNASEPEPHLIASCMDNTLFHIACYRGHTDIVKLLFKHSKKLDININEANAVGLTPLHVAEDDTKLIAFLLKHCKSGPGDYGRISQETLNAIAINRANGHNTLDESE